PLRNNYDRNRMVAFMKGAMKTCSNRSRNPVGRDSTEEFLDTFLKLTAAERKVFLEKAELALKENKPLDKEALSSVANIKHSIPLYVDSVKGKDSFSDFFGTERHPYKTLDHATDIFTKNRYGSLSYTYGTMIKFICDPKTCPIEECSVVGCETKVCRDHSTKGDGQLDEEEGLPFLLLRACEVSSNGISAEASLGYYNQPFEEARYRPDHLTVCHRLTVPGGNGKFCYEDDGEDEEDDEGKEEKEECGFRCCEGSRIISVVMILPYIDRFSVFSQYQDSRLDFKKAE
ncbi:hypothetical protein HDU76_009057, partial [Blyttiomyces sp. JEL0837]